MPKMTSALSLEAPKLREKVDEETKEDREEKLTTHQDKNNNNNNNNSEEQQQKGDALSLYAHTSVLKHLLYRYTESCSANLH